MNHWYANKKIKLLVQQFPEAREILANNGIRCAECTAHDCFVGQIPESEELSFKQEAELMRALDRVLPEREPQVDATSSNPE
ncbi:MAG: hypothetical protein U0790_22820 [Isosphaeraceae bacterium]